MDVRTRIGGPFLFIVVTTAAATIANQDQESFILMKSSVRAFFGRCRFGDVTESVFAE